MRINHVIQIIYHFTPSNFKYSLQSLKLILIPFISRFLVQKDKFEQ
jgi:hypothetical protein